MKIKPILITKILALVVIILYLYIIGTGKTVNTVNAILTLLLSLLFLFMSRKNMMVAIVAFFIFYCNYSIVIGDYILGAFNIGIPEINNLYYYGIAIKIMLLFMSIIVLFYKAKPYREEVSKLVPKDNSVLFYGIIAILVYILIFEIDRGEVQSYSVRITPIYEYSKLLFLFAYYFSGGKKKREIIFFSLILLFSLQDIYYGGRITSLQLIILLVITVLFNKLTFKKLVGFGFIGIFVYNLVNIYRVNYNMGAVNVKAIIASMYNNLFVFDTPVYAYYASATHIGASELVSNGTKMESLISFIKTIFVGGSGDITGNVTQYVNNNYYTNIGGGLLPTYFYFWMGWIGILLIGLIVIFLINRIGDEKNDYQKLVHLSIILSVPRWYLYSPNPLFRGAILFTSLLYLAAVVAHTILINQRPMRIEQVDLK